MAAADDTRGVAPSTAASSMSAQGAASAQAVERAAPAPDSDEPETSIATGTEAANPPIAAADVIEEDGRVAN